MNDSIDDPQTRCVKCNRTIRQYTADRHEGLCALCDDGIPKDFEMPHELVARIAALEIDPRKFRQACYVKGAEFVQGILDGMNRTAVALHLLTHPQGLSACFVADAHEPPKSDACQPIDCECWLDVCAGMELVWPNGKVSTVHGVELWVGRPAVAGKPLIVSGRDWERTGRWVDGKPTALADTQRCGEPDFNAILKRMGIESPDPTSMNRDGTA